MTSWYLNLHHAHHHIHKELLEDTRHARRAEVAAGVHVQALAVRLARPEKRNMKKGQSSQCRGSSGKAPSTSDTLMK